MKEITILFLLLPFLSGFFGYVFLKGKGRKRDIFYDVILFIEFALSIYILLVASKETFYMNIPEVMGVGFSVKINAIRGLLMLMATTIWLLCNIYSTQYLKKYRHIDRYYSFFVMTLGAALGMFMSENILNLFTFFEIMALTSYILIIHDEDNYSQEAGRIYIIMSIAGGMITLLGIFLLYDYSKVLEFSKINESFKGSWDLKYITAFLILTTFWIKACMFPLHIWMPKVYTAAPTPVTAVLSAVLSKAGVFGIFLVGYHMVMGEWVFGVTIIVFSLITMFIGGILAIFQRNTKRVLAYSSMSQLGYIVLAIGLFILGGKTSTYGFYGFLTHMLVHGFLKALLFLNLGVIYMFIDDLSLNKIRGFGRHKVILKFTFLIGFLGMIGMPGFGSFVSKNLIHHGFLEFCHELGGNFGFWLDMLFNLCSAFSVVYMMKLFVGIFVERNEIFKGQYKEKITKRAWIPLVILSGIIIMLANPPEFLIRILNASGKLAQVESIHADNFYDFQNIISVLKPIFMGVIIYYGLVYRYLRTEKNGLIEYINPSTEWFSIEADFLIPFSKDIMKVTTYLFGIVDRMFVGTGKNLNEVVKKIGNIKIIKLDKNMKKIEFKKAKDIYLSMTKELDTLNSAIMLIGTMLVGILMIFMFF